MTEPARLPAPPINGRIQRKTPTFQRPSLSVHSGATAAVHREWRVVPVTALAAGDVVPGVGVLHYVTENHYVPQHGLQTAPGSDTEEFHWTVTVVGGEDNDTRSYHGSDTVLAFTAAR